MAVTPLLRAATPPCPILLRIPFCRNHAGLRRVRADSGYADVLRPGTGADPVGGDEVSIAESDSFGGIERDERDQVELIDDPLADGGPSGGLDAELVSDAARVESRRGDRFGPAEGSAGPELAEHRFGQGDVGGQGWVDVVVEDAIVEDPVPRPVA